MGGLREVKETSASVILVLLWCRSYARAVRCGEYAKAQLFG